MSQTVGLVIPCYNEKETIADLIGEVRNFVPEVRIVVVDDSPDDATESAVRPLLNEFTHLIHRRTKGGRGSAVIEGLRLLMEHDVDVALEMDADFSHPPSQLPALIARMNDSGLDLLIASRYVTGSRIENWPLSRTIFSALSNWLTRFVLRVPVHDYTNGFRGYSRGAIRVIVSECGKLGAGFIALSEILVNVYYRDLRVAEVPTVFVNRVRGDSSLNSKEIWSALRGLIGIKRLKNQLVRNRRARP